MPKLRIIADLWASYEKKVLPFGAPAVQVLETRRAFYAGASGLLAAICGILEEDAEPTPQDLRVMDAIHAELEAFSASVLAGQN